MQIVPVLALFAVSLQPLPIPDSVKSAILDVNGDAPSEGIIARFGTVRFRLPNSRVSGGLRFRIVWGHEGNSIALSRDAKVLVGRSEIYKQSPENITEHVETRLELMDLTTGKVIRSQVVASLPDGSMKFPPDGQTIIFSSSSKVASVDARTGKLVKTMDIGEQKAWDRVLTGLSYDGKLVAMQPSQYVRDVPVQIWDVQTGKKVATLPGRGAQCRGFAFAPDGKRLLLASITPTSVTKDSMAFGDGSKLVVACIDVQKREIVAELALAVDRHVTFGPDGETVGIESPKHDAIHIKHLREGTLRDSREPIASRLPA
jgi:WD40 repeat protein